MSVAGCCEYDLELFLAHAQANIKRYVSLEMWLWHVSAIDNA